MTAYPFTTEKGRSRFVLVVTPEELEILQGVVRKAEMHTPRIPGTERLLSRLINMKKVLNKVFGEFRQSRYAIEDRLKTTRINETAFKIDKEAFLNL